MATLKDASVALLNRLGLEVTDNRLIGLVAFGAIEGGHFHNEAKFNPWNTTLHMPGSYQARGTIVQAYQSWEQGIEANARTMKQSNMRNLLNALIANVSPKEFLKAVTSTPWCPGCDYTPYDPYALYKNRAGDSDSTSLVVSPSSSTSSTAKTVATVAGIAGATALGWYLVDPAGFKRAFRFLRI